MNYESLDSDQFSKLVDQSRQGDAIDKLVVIFTGYLGLRVQEIRHLRTNWIDFQRWEINIPAKDEHWPPEGVKARQRTIPYGDDKKVKADIGYYFRDHDSLDVSKTTIYNRLEDMASKADIRMKVTPRKLRHTAAERWVNQGKDIMDLQKLMGYEGLETTKKFFE